MTICENPIYSWGIRIINASNIEIYDTSFKGFNIDLFIVRSSNIDIIKNYFKDAIISICIQDSSRITISESDMINAKIPFYITGSHKKHFITLNITNDNYINNKKVLIVINQTNKEIKDVEISYLGIINSENITISNVSIKYGYIFIAASNYTIIEKSNTEGTFGVVAYFSVNCLFLNNMVNSSYLASKIAFSNYFKFINISFYGKYSIRIIGMSASNYIHTFINSTFWDVPMYYITNLENKIISMLNVSLLAIVNSTNITLKSIKVSKDFIVISFSSNITIENIIHTHSTYSLFIYNSSLIKIANSTFKGSLQIYQSDQIRLKISHFYGASYIWLYNNKEINIEENTFDGLYQFFSLETKKLMFSHNILTNVKDIRFIYFGPSDELIFINNMVYGNFFMHCTNTKAIFIVNNTIKGNADYIIDRVSNVLIDDISLGKKVFLRLSNTPYYRTFILIMLLNLILEYVFLSTYQKELLDLKAIGTLDVLLDRFSLSFIVFIISMVCFGISISLAYAYILALSFILIDIQWYKLEFINVLKKIRQDTNDIQKEIIIKTTESLSEELITRIKSYWQKYLFRIIENLALIVAISFYSFLVFKLSLFGLISDFLFPSWTIVTLLVLFFLGPIILPHYFSEKVDSILLNLYLLTVFIYVFTAYIMFVKTELTLIKFIAFGFVLCYMRMLILTSKLIENLSVNLLLKFKLKLDNIICAIISLAIIFMGAETLEILVCLGLTVFIKNYLIMTILKKSRI